MRKTWFQSQMTNTFLLLVKWNIILCPKTTNVSNTNKITSWEIVEEYMNQLYSYFPIGCKSLSRGIDRYVINKLQSLKQFNINVLPGPD